MTEYQVKTSNLWALLVDILLSPTLNPDLDYSEEVHMTTGHFVDGHLRAMLFDTTLPVYFHFKYVGRIQGLVAAHRDTLLL